MLSYQHIYHAGCLADVQKHSVLAVICEQMVRKDKPLYYMETHAGRGIYDLKSVEAEKTGEAREGILAMRTKLPQAHPFTQVLAKFPDNIYPGSPAVAHSILRKTDRMFLTELHPQEFTALKNNMNYVNVFVQNDDGYTGVLAKSPPLVRRGLVMVDPSYEVKDEYLQAAKFVVELHKKWAEAVIILWYPILRTGLHKDMCEILEKAKLPKFYRQEIIFPGKHADNTLGSGIIICNLPFGSENGLEEIRSFFNK